MADKKLVTASSIKVGNYIIMDNIACRVSSVQTSRPGKHGHAKCRIEAVGLIDGQKKINIYPGHDNVTVPIIEKKSAQVLSISKNIATVMDLESYETFDLNIPAEVKDQIKEGSQVVYWIILNDKILKQIK